MNGLISSTPSQSAIRLTVSGFLLMLVQSALLLMTPSLTGDAGTLIWLLTGDPLAALTQPWGRLVAVKLMIVAVLLGLAALNKLRLTPALARTGDGRPLLRSIRWEMATFVVILLVTAFFTSLFAPEHASAAPM